MYDDITFSREYRMRRLILAAAFAAALLFSDTAGARNPFSDIDRSILTKREMPMTARAGGDGFLPAPQPTANQALFDVLHYDVYIAFDEVTRQVEGRVVIEALSLSDTLRRVDINADQALDILSVEQSGHGPAAFTRAGDVVTIDLVSPAASGETAAVEITYDGFPNQAYYTGLFFTDSGSITRIHSLSEPWQARTWWPCKDYPDDKATFDMELAVRDPLFAASNGNYVGERDTTHWGGPFTVYSWDENYPMPPYLFSVSAAEYVLLTEDWLYSLIDTMTITNYVYPDLVDEALVDLDIQVPALFFFSQKYGMYPFVEEKYGVALAPIGGGMEHQTLCTYGHPFIRGDHSYDWLYIHELAHQWFGDATTCEDWTHIWINEGWASYSEALWAEHEGGEAALRDYMTGPLYEPDRWLGPILRSPDEDDPWYYFNSVVYSKAAWVLHMARRILGDAAFFGAARDLLTDPAHLYGNANTDDMVAAFENSYGSDLSWFFDPWLTRTDLPHYEWSWNAFESVDGRPMLSIQVSQLTAEPYDMPVDFEVITHLSRTTTVLRVDEPVESFLVETDGLASTVLFDPDDWILCNETETTTTGDGDAPAVTFLEQNWPNPFNPSTTIRFGLERASRVRLEVFDLRGALVTVLADGRMEAGTREVTWNGAADGGRPAASGVYFYRLTTPSFTDTRKMVLLR